MLHISASDSLAWIHRLPLSAAELSSLLVFATAMSFTPGPNTTLSAALAANGGLKRALPFVLAVPVGWGLLLLSCSLGLGAVLQAQPALRGGLKWAGLAYLLWLAFKLSRAGTLASAEGRGFDVGFAKGVALQFVNIKAWMNALMVSAGWVLASVPVSVSAPAAVWTKLALVLPLMMFFGLASNLSYALVGSALRAWLSQGRRLLWFNRCLAAVLVATAFWMTQL
jgi:threonine/homoserine/homoserine lactone efflux protein